MAFFNEFTVNLKQKWLQYYQANRNWLVLQMDLNPVPTPDGGRRPASALILGTINALDSDAAQLMMPFSQLNPDPDRLVEVLGLNFDPDMALGNPSASSATTPMAVSGGVSMPPAPPPVAPPPITGEMAAVSGVAAAAMGGAAIASALDETEAQLEMDLEAEEDLDMDLHADDDLAVEDDLDIGLDTDDDLGMDLDADDDLADLQLDGMEDADSDDLTQLESATDINDTDDFDLGDLDLDEDLGGDDATSDDLDDLDLGDLGDDDLGDLSDDDFDEMSLDDLGEVTTGDLDEIDLEGLTDAPDDDGDISLSDLK
ncbi:MAG: DUF5331 domain-containing protein [Microcoleaceae cyanobacterium]